MEICQSCGGVIGKDCFNPAECAIIAGLQATENLPCECCAQLQAELEEWRNAEGSVCPEDVGFVEYIKVLQATNKSLQEKIERLKAVCYRESGVLTEALKRKNNKSMIEVVADSLAEHALKDK